MSTQLKVAPPKQSQMTGGAPLALCPPVTVRDCWAAVIVPRWHESPQEIPPTKHPPGWNVGIALVLESLSPRQHWPSSRGMWRSEECWRPTLGWRGEIEGRRLENSGGELQRLAEDLRRGFGASSRGCSANPQLAGWGEVWGPLCWGGRPSLWSVLHPFCQTHLRSEACSALTPGRGKQQETHWWRGLNLISIQRKYTTEKKVKKNPMGKFTVSFYVMSKASSSYHCEEFKLELSNC